MDAISVFFSQPFATPPPCPPDGNRPLYEGKYVVTHRRVDGSRQEDKAVAWQKAAKKNAKIRMKTVF